MMFQGIEETFCNIFSCCKNAKYRKHLIFKYPIYHVIFSFSSRFKSSININYDRLCLGKITHEIILVYRCQPGVVFSFTKSIGKLFFLVSCCMTLNFEVKRAFWVQLLQSETNSLGAWPCNFLQPVFNWLTFPNYFSESKGY